EKNRPDIIINATGTYSAKEALTFYNLNSNAVINIFESITKISEYNPSILLIGTAAEYGIVSIEDLPLKESLKSFPVTHYGISKFCATLNAISYYQKLGMKVYIARVFNALGPGLPSCLLVSTILDQLLKNKSKEIKLGNINSKRDFIDIKDICDALEKILFKGSPGKIYNVCTGKSHSVKDILDIIKHNIGDFKITIDSKRFRSSDLDDVYGDYSRINTETGWLPEISLNESISKMIEHYK
ncbi:MAG: NAD-dependent epimerase/dehydratase family protein, partial [Bacteroidales bacterium]|nr:NAD-dependent epimerase/dehydratase family protein [Bacteroidales bacterium]